MTDQRSLQPSATRRLEQLGRAEISAHELVGDCLERISEADTRLNAVVTPNEQALDEARAADAARAGGDTRSLLGLPVTIKDSLATKGLRTTGGSCARERTVPEQDATVVERLRAAGAIVVAKTNLPEYSWSYETDNALCGRTSNPHDDARTPGGSSGGEAALLGADASIVGVGTDGGGSIRVPSHYCGTVGLRTTVGRVPETGVWPPMRPTGFMDLLCVGPMARHVEDLELVLTTIAGPDGIDPYAPPVPLGRAADVPLARLRVNAYADDGELRVTDATVRAVETAASILAERGCAVESRPAKGFTEATDLFFATMAADGGAQARADLEPAGGRHAAQMTELLDALRPLALDAAGFFELKRRIFEFRARVRAFVARSDVVVCPVTPGCAPLHSGWPGEELGHDSYQAFNHLHVFALGGLPAASVPIGSEDGMPIGVQVISQPWREDVVLSVAAALEQSVSYAG